MYKKKNKFLKIYIKSKILLKFFFKYLNIYKNTVNFFKSHNNVISYKNYFNKTNKILFNSYTCVNTFFVFKKFKFLVNNENNINLFLIFKFKNEFINFYFFSIRFNYKINSFKFSYSNKNTNLNKYFIDFYCYKNNYYSNYYYNKNINIFIDKKNFKFTKFNNSIILNFLEKFFSKKFFIKSNNSILNGIEDIRLKYFVKSNKFVGYSFKKYFNIKEFIEIIWYSIFLRDLSMFSNWITKQMEKMVFKNHKRFVNFLQNFFLKNCDVFLNILMIKGFYFDIRGKVGVTGSSKKRHVCFKIGTLNKSDKKSNLEVNQNLVRTYSGVLGLTYIISY